MTTTPAAKPAPKAATTKAAAKPAVQAPPKPTPLPARPASRKPPFDPAPFVGRINGNEYLDVKWRLVWIRDRHPEAEIETQLIDLSTVGTTPQGLAIERALFKAVMRLPSGALATGYGSETSTDFRDFIEKAETKAIGRAAAHLGFGTQFVERDETVVDTPVERPGPAKALPPAPPRVAADASDAGQPASRAQLDHAKRLAFHLGINALADFDARCISRYSKPHGELTRREASLLIDEFLAERAPAATARS